MNKLIIDNRSDATDYQALRIAQLVVDEGRISDNGTSYCAVIRIWLGDVSYKVCCYRNKKSDHFRIFNEK